MSYVPWALKFHRNITKPSAPTPSNIYNEAPSSYLIVPLTFGICIPFTSVMPLIVVPWILSARRVWPTLVYLVHLWTVFSSMFTTRNNSWHRGPSPRSQSYLLWGQGGIPVHLSKYLLLRLTIRMRRIRWHLRRVHGLLLPVFLLWHWVMR